jgi:zinc transporter ZupT
MESPFTNLLIFGFLAALANILGGVILFSVSSHDRYRVLLKYLLALGAGFMLAVTFLEILPKTIELWQRDTGAAAGLTVPMALMLGGYLLTQFFEHTIAPHIHLGEEVTTPETLKRSSAYAAIGGLVIHTFFDGVSIAAASAIDWQVGLLVFLAVFLHKFPEGFTIGSMILAAGRGRREVLVATSLIGLVTIIGILVFYLIGSRIGFTVAYALPIAGGVTLYVAASDLIPEVNHHGGKSPFVSLSVFAGVALFSGTQALLHHIMEP